MDEKIKKYMDEYCNNCTGYKEHGCVECDIESERVMKMIREKISDE